MTEGGSLTMLEARERSTLVEVQRYDVDVDLRGLLEGEVWAATSTVVFRCTRPGSSTFVDCLAEVGSATLNGVELDVSDLPGGRIPLRDLTQDNVLVVTSTQPDTGAGNAILRTVDPSDGLVYVWTSFEPDGARRAWACFDQPDLKAPHRFTVKAPSSWKVTSNGAPQQVTDLADGGRVWAFPDTPALSTYVVVVNAGPFHEIRQERAGYSLGLYCRQSLRRYLERDAEELLRVTEQGLAFFGERFAMPFPQSRYDQVFVPNMGGAMENWGCVTWTDSVLFRSPPTYLQRAATARVLLHEMAHMWFGDLVTMRWWDDLWLNEAFASWAATWAAVSATEYVDDWATLAAGLQLTGYQMDMSPARHAIRGEVPDVAQAMANFDAITYVKGSSVLRQLAGLVGEDVFVQALRSYFRDHAWGSTTLSDLVDAVATASGRDLRSWTADWLDRAGTDTISLVDTTLLTISPDRPAPRTHRLDIGCYMLDGTELQHVQTLDVETSGTATALAAVLPDADLYLLNQSDLTFASVRTDETSLEVALTAAPSLPTTLSRSMVVATAWDMLTKGELSTGEFLACLLPVLAREPSPGLVEPFFALALRATEYWTPVSLVPGRLGRLAGVSELRSADPGHRTSALRVLAACAATTEHFELLDVESTADVDLAWRVQTRRAALGRHDPDAVADLLARDPDPDAAARALGVTAARADDAAKQEAWSEIFEKRTVPSGQPAITLARCFWQPVQQHLLQPWSHRYLDEVTRLAGGGLLATGGLMRAMMPPSADETFIDRAREIATEPGTNPTVRTTLLTGADQLARSLRARS
ncbi:MAG: aminopeptidase N [Nocardioides sp.]|nr:aminopeptidase N [Nocardioides sp.]